MPLFSAAILLFLVMDPVGNIPLFVSALSQVEARRRTRVLLRELVFALLVMIVFLFSGRPVLKLLQLSDPALTIASGIVLFLIAIRMIFPSRESMFGENPEGEPFIVPLAIPLVAGPSVMATVLLLVAREPTNQDKWLIALLFAWLMSAIILMLSIPMGRILGSRGLIACERLMGMLLTAIAIQMLLNGFTRFLG
jgi:multiple antibiotic resistance protein